MAQRMETPQFQALHRHWYQAPPDVLARLAEEERRDAVVARRVDQQEAANFAAFSGMFASVAAQTQTPGR